jgi:hypothetical protein
MIPALKEVNNAFLKSDLKKPPFSGSKFSLSLNSAKLEFYPNIKPGQTPRKLAALENRKDKPFSTVILSMVGSITLSSIGTCSFRVGNKMCSITTYIPFGPQIQCLNCVKLGHPKAFCKAAVTYTIYAMP